MPKFLNRLVIATWAIAGLISGFAALVSTIFIVQIVLGVFATFMFYGAYKFHQKE